MGNIVSNVSSSGEPTDEPSSSTSSTTMPATVSARPTHIPMPPSPFANFSASYSPSPSHRLDNPFESPLLSPHSPLVFYTAPSSPIVETPTGPVPQLQCQNPGSPPPLPVLHINVPQIIPPASQFSHSVHTPPPPTYHPVPHHSPNPHSPPDHAVHLTPAPITEDSFPVNAELPMDDVALGEEGLSTVERIYLCSCSKSSFHRVFIANALPDLLEQVTPHEAIEYVLPLLNTLAMDEDELVKEAFSSKLVAIIWWFSTHCQLIPEDNEALNREDSLNPPEFHGHEDVPKITVQTFTPILGTLLLSPNGIVGGAARYAVVALLERIRQLDEAEPKLGSDSPNPRMQTDPPSPQRGSSIDSYTTLVEHDTEETFFIGLFGREERALFEKEMLYQIVIGMGRLDADSETLDEYADFEQDPPDGLDDRADLDYSKTQDGVVHCEPDVKVVLNDDDALQGPDLDLRIVSSRLYVSEHDSAGKTNRPAAKQEDNDFNPYFPIVTSPSPSNAVPIRSGNFGSPASLSSSGSSTSPHSSTTSASASPDNFSPSGESSPDVAAIPSSGLNATQSPSSSASSSPSTVMERDVSPISSPPTTSSDTVIPSSPVRKSGPIPTQTESSHSYSPPASGLKDSQEEGFSSDSVDKDWIPPALRPSHATLPPPRQPSLTSSSDPPSAPSTSGPLHEDSTKLYNGYGETSSQENLHNFEEMEDDLEGDQAAVGRLSSMSLMAAVAASGCLDDTTKSAFVREVERVSHDSVYWVRREACFALGALAKIVPEEVVQLSLTPMLQHLVADPVHHVRHSSLFALPAILSRLPVRERKQLALDVIVPMTMDESSDVRAGVLEALGEVIYTFHTEDEKGKHKGRIQSDADESETPPKELLKMFLGRTQDRRVIDGQQPHSSLGSGHELSPPVANDRQEAFYADPSRPLICAFSFPAVALTLGRERWSSMLRESYLSLALDDTPGVRRTLAASLGEMAKIIGPVHAQRDLMKIWRESIRHEEEDVRMKAIDCLSSFAGAIGKESQEEVLREVLNVWQSDGFRGWREREGIAKNLFGCVGAVAYETWGIIAQLEVLSLGDTVNAVREAALDALPKLWVTFKDHTAVEILRTKLRDMARCDTSRKRMTYIACQQTLLLSEANGPPPVEIDDELCTNLASLASDGIIGVRIGVARLISAIHVEFSRRKKPVSSSLMDIAHVLQQDDSHQVRSYVTNCSAELFFPPEEVDYRIRKPAASAPTFSRPPPTLIPSVITGSPL